MRFSRVRALSVIKFPSAVRVDSYRERRCDEQAAFSRRMDRRSFVAREILTGLALFPMRSSHGPEPTVDVAIAATPGGLVSEYRRIRGLESARAPVESGSRHPPASSPDHRNG